MNQSDIEVGKVYRGKNRVKRKVTEISNNLGLKWVTYISNSRKSYCTLDSFVHWAKERL